MKANKLLVLMLASVLCFSLTACQGNPLKDATEITLSDEQILVDGVAASTNADDAVYVANDPYVQVPDGNDETEWELAAKEHTVIHITKPGNYALSGTLSLGQIAVDLGEDALTDENAVVTIALNNANITCEVAPAIIFYNAYECVATDADEIDTTKAGANIYVADNTTNYVNGSYVLDEYEAAVYSNVSMNINGGKKDSGALFVNAFTDFGDAIHSQGYLVINGGTVNATACAVAANAGLSSENGIYINGGEVVATGHVYDEIANGKQNFAVFSFVESQMGGNIYEVKNAKEKSILSATCDNDFTILVVSGKNLKNKTYSFWCEDVQFFVADGLAPGFMGDPTMVAPEGMAPTESTTFEPDIENADIVFDIQKGGNIFHVFY